jgi:4-hydroxybenzoate polyprenyltransferase
MTGITGFLEDITHTNLILAFSTVFAALITFLLLGLPINCRALIVIFLVTFSIYTFNRFTDAEDKINNPKRVIYMNTHKHILFFAIIAYSISVLFAFFENMITFFIIVLPLIGIFLYSIKWFPDNNLLSGGRRIKDLHILKNIFVALIWSVGVVFLPLSYHLFELTVPIILIWFFFFGRFLINTIVFDLKDVEGDRIYHIKTIPVKIGYHNTLKLINILNLFFFIVIAILTIKGYLPALMHIPNVIGTAYSLIYSYYASKHRQNIHILCELFVDAEYAIMALPLIAYVYLL